MNKSNVVYKINCNDCKASYVGQTGRRVSVRIKEHHKKYFEDDSNSSLHLHRMQKNHTINFNNIKLLDCETNKEKRLFSEALHIHTQNIFLNKQFEINSLPKEYNFIIKNCEFLSS